MTGELIERDDERLALMIPYDDETVSEEDRRAPFAELVSHVLTPKLLAPEQLALHVVGIQPV